MPIYKVSEDGQRKRVKAPPPQPTHLSPQQRQQARRDLRMLDEPTIDGGLNLCFGDGYYAKSLERKYGMSIPDLRAAL